MTAKSRTTIHTSSSTSTEPTTPATTERYSIQTPKHREHDPRTPRSNAAHLCITIDGGGPASGRPQPTLRAVDLAPTPFKIVSMDGWPSWC